MYTYITFALLVCGALTSPQNGHDLKLDQIFRTPKDFSKVNFDHFEILERNNFDSTPATTKTDVHGTIDHPPKSVANAQVMLRFGGDDISNCQGLPVSSRIKEIEKTCCETREIRPLCPKPLSIVGTRTIYPYNEYRYPAYPAYYPSGYPTSQCAYAYPPPPYDFPGYYYGVRPIATYPYGLYNGPVPSEEVVVTEPSNTCGDPCCDKPSCPCEPVCEEKETFLECSTPLKPPPCASRPKLLGTEILSDEKILDVNIPDVQSTSKLDVKDKIYLTKQGNRVLEETSVEAPIQNVVKINNIDGSCIDPNPYPHKLSYTEESIREADKESVCCPKQNLGALLDQALVPLTCQNCQDKRRVLVSYPITPCGGKLTTIPEEEIVVSKCTCCNNCNCESCNRERDCNIPYGKRFSADLDCLLKVAPSGYCGTRCIPPTLYRTSPCDIPSKIYPTIRDPCCPEPVDRCDEPCAKVEIITPYQNPCKTPCSIPCRPLCDTPCSTTCRPLYESLCPPCSVPCKALCDTPCSRPLCESPCSIPCDPICDTPCSVPCRPLCETPGSVPCDTPCGARAVQVVPPCREPPRILNQIVSVPPVSAPSVINQVLNVPPLLYGGCKTFSDAFFSSLPLAEKSKVILDGITTSTGAQIYSDPLKSIIYKEPTITNVVSVKNPIVPAVEETKIVEPHLYKVIPKYDVIGRDDIASLNIPDLVPTNRYLCANCNNLLPPRAVCSREYLPIERGVPLIREVPSYVPSFIRDVPLIREAPIVEKYVSHRYCPTCAKYTGELNE